ncbi:MAG TPA: hypothetical protein DIS90_15305 [Cytophagales bacterium]|nr:hypothetical protein [Cytophagales bacterium]HCR54359.1 hypothetical protein [Cytophagales bacterium]
MSRGVTSITFLSKKAIVLLGLSILIIAQSGYAQFIPEGRYEKEVKMSDNRFMVISLKENGIALIREKNKYKDGNRLWEFILLDQELGERWQADVEIKAGYMMIGYEYAGQYLFGLFREGDRDSNKFILLTLHIGSYEIKQFEIKQEFLFRPTHFTMAGENAIFGGYVSSEPAVMLYETSTQLLKVIPGFFLKDTELLDLRANSNNTFNALLIERNTLDKRHLVIKTFDASGGLLLEDEIEIGKDINLLTGISSSLKREELILLGTYTEGTGREALGFYSVLVDPFSDQSINYFPFANLTHALDYLPSKRIAKIKSKSKERMEVGKAPDYKAHVLPIRIEETEEGFFFLSEMYDPASSTNRNTWNTYNNPYYGYGYSPYSYNPFMNRYANSPYSFNNSSQNTSAKMIESILTLFDSKGKLIWDNSLKYENIKRYATEQISDFVIKDNLVYLAYKKESEIHVSTSSLILEPELDTVGIKLKYPSDIVRNETEDDTGIRYWYNDYSFVWGYQSIKDTDKKNEDPVRYVFYINKFASE